MTKKLTIFDKRRPILALRDWLHENAADYDRLTSDTILHADIQAGTDALGILYYYITYSTGGRKMIAQDVFMVSPDGATLVEVETLPLGLTAAWWWSGTHAVMRGAHPALIAHARAMGAALPHYNKVSVHCHYVRILWGDPWPRGFQNAKSLDGPAPWKVERERAKLVSEIDAATGKRRRGRPRKVFVLPDWL